MLLLANAFWGLSFPLMKAAGQLTERISPEANPWFFTAMMLMPRFILAAVVLGVVLGKQLGAITVGEWKQGLWLGGFAVLGMVLQADGLQFTEASTSAFLSQFYAILIPLWLAVRWRQNPGARVWGCVLLVILGGGVLGRFDWQTLRLGRGETETLIASVFFMGQILTLARKDFSANRVLPITFVMFAVEGVAFGGMAAVTAPSGAAIFGAMSLPAWWGFTLALTVFCTLGSFLLMNKWQPHISPTEAGILYGAEPIFSSAFSLFLPGLFSAWAVIAYANEMLTPHLLIGGGLITVANAILQLRPRRAKVGTHPSRNDAIGVGRETP
jgi:drug/metabolite transporter (DMT)-like permease